MRQKHIKKCQFSIINCLIWTKIILNPNLPLGDFPPGVYPAISTLSCDRKFNYIYGYKWKGGLYFDMPNTCHRGHLVQGGPGLCRQP